MSDIAIKVGNLSKQYRLGTVGTGTLSHDLNRFWAKVRGKEDPYLQVGQINDRTTKAESDYVWALKDINFEVKKGEILGIIGKNGAGKSTLLKILSRVTSPTTGSIKMNGRVGSLLEVGTGFHPELTGRENIFLNGAILGMRRWEIQKKLDEIINFSGVEKYLDTPVKRYSSGMKVRLGFAVAAHLEPEILIVDEVLAVGDASFQNKCIGKINQVSTESGATVVFVSHNMNSMRTLCSRAIMIDNGGVVDDSNDVTSIVNKYLGSNLSIQNEVTFSFNHGEIKNICLGKKQFLIGDVISLIFDIVLSKDLPMCTIGVGLIRLDGVGITSVWEDRDLKVDKNCRCEITLDDVYLSAGLYKFALGITSCGKSEYYNDSLATFEIFESISSDKGSLKVVDARNGVFLNKMKLSLGS